MIDLTAGIMNIINDPMSRGIGAGIQQNKTTTTKATTTQTTAAKNTVQSVLSSGNASTDAKTTAQKVTGTVQSTNNTSLNDIYDTLTSGVPVQRISQQIFGNQTNYVTNLVNEMLDATVGRKLKDEIKKGKLSLQTSKIGETYATAVAYYKKLYDGSFIMTELRNKTEKNISDLINKRINDKLFSWQNGSSEWTKLLLSKSKLASSLRNAVNTEVHNAIGSLVSDKIISDINDSLLKNLKSISGNIGTTLNTQFKGQIENVVKLKSVVQEKIAEFTKLKETYEKKIADTIKSLTTKIGEAIQQFTQKLVDTIGGSVKNLVSGLKLA